MNSDKYVNKGYPPNWPEIARATKKAAGWRCIRCRHWDEASTGHVLTVHHLDGDKLNSRWWNLVALCQRCHLSVQGRVVMDRPFFLEHSEWFKPYVAGFYAWKYLGKELSRGEVMDSLDELLALERVV